MIPQLRVALALVAAMVVGGCPNNDGGVGSDEVRVELVNSTAGEVTHAVFYHPDDGALAAIFASSEFGAAVLAAGGSATFTLPCDEVGTLLSNGATLRLGEATAQTAATAALQRGAAYECGDVIRFEFVGDIATFDVVVTVNGTPID